MTFRKLVFARVLSSCFNYKTGGSFSAAPAVEKRYDAAMHEDACVSLTVFDLVFERRWAVYVLIRRLRIPWLDDLGKLGAIVLFLLAWKNAACAEELNLPDEPPKATARQLPEGVDVPGFHEPANRLTLKEAVWSVQMVLGIALCGCVLLLVGYYLFYPSHQTHISGKSSDDDRARCREIRETRQQESDLDGWL